MANELSTIGVKVKYACETTAGTRPTTGFTELNDIVSVSAMNDAADKLEVTNLKDTCHRYINGLKNYSDTLTFTANLTTAFKTAWGTMVSAAQTALAANKACWFEFTLPGHTDSWYVSVIPEELGYQGAEVGVVQQISCYAAVADVEGYSTAST